MSAIATPQREAQRPPGGRIGTPQARVEGDNYNGKDARMMIPYECMAYESDRGDMACRQCFGDWYGCDCHGPNRKTKKGV